MPRGRLSATARDGWGSRRTRASTRRRRCSGRCCSTATDPPQRARGLVWLTLARDSATADETWIMESYDRAIAKASEDDRAMALQMLKDWVQGKKN